jgi:F-type H+-transporting ATPase subunit c
MTLPVLGMIQAANMAAGYGPAMLARGLGAGLVVLGAAIGIGLIGSRMTESMARQPEIAGNIQTGAIILAAFIEGAALFGLVIAFLIPA